MSELDGVWYDGRSSRGSNVRVSSPMPGILRIVSDHESLDVMAHEVRLNARLGRTPRILTLDGDRGQVECADSPLLDTWLPDRNRIETIADWLERRKLAIAAAVIATLIGVLLFFRVGLPWAADRIATHIPVAAERAVGRQALGILDRTHQLRPTQLPAEKQAELGAKFLALTRGLPRAADLRLMLRDAPGIGPNAFALPGGYVVLTDQLVKLASSDEELMAVLAHEVGHHEHRHALRMALEDSGVVALNSFLLGDVSGTGALSVSVPVVLLDSGYSRGHEREADSFAIELLRRRGYSPAALAGMLHRLTQLQGDDPGGMSYLSTHPPSSERIEAAERAAGERTVPVR